MRVALVIDDKLMTEAMRASGAKTKRETIELGLRTLVSLGHQAEIRRYRGKLTWDGNLHAGRTNG